MIELNSLAFNAYFDTVRSAVQKYGIGVLPVVQTIQPRQTVVAKIFRCHPGDGQVSHRLAWNPGKLRGNVEGPFVDRFVIGAAKAQPQGVQQTRREDMLVLERYVLIARTFLSVCDGRLGGRRPVHVAVVESVTPEQRVYARELVIDAALCEVLIRGLRPCEEILRNPTT